MALIKRLPEPEDERITQAYIDGCEKSWNIDSIQLMQFADDTARNIQRVFSPGKYKTLLDIGCCTGDITAALSRAGFDASGLDRSEDAVALARKHYPGTCFYLGSAYDSGVIGKFDLIISTWSIHEMDISRLMPGVFNSLNPGGAFWVMDLHRYGLFFSGIESLNAYHLRESEGERALVEKYLGKGLEADIYAISMFSQMASYTPREVKKSMSEAGFAKISAATYPIFSHYEAKGFKPK